MLRIIALITMAIDHFGLFFFPDLLIFRIIGRLAFPLFALGIAQGYHYTKNLFKYGERIFFLALISQVVFYLLGMKGLNICFTLFLGLLFIYFYEKRKEGLFSYFFLALIILIAFFSGAEYGIYGIIMIFFFHFFQNRNKLFIFQSLLVFIYVFFDFSKLISIFAIPAFFLIAYLSDYRVKLNRYFQYLFYPLHLLLIYLALLILNAF